MTYYLRIEGVNLSNFIYDTSNLQVIRGGGLLLLNATNKVEDIISKHLGNIDDNNLRDLQNQLESLKQQYLLTKSEKNKKKKIKQKIKKLKTNKKSKLAQSTITKGASWGLYQLDNIDDKTALIIKKAVIDYFNTDPDYQHATIMVDLFEKTSDREYQLDRSKIQTLNRWQQLQSPSIAIPKLENSTTACYLEKTRPAVIATDKLPDLGGKKEFLSRSVNQRREYGGTRKKTEFYKKRTELELAFTQDLSTLSQCADKGVLNGKIAFIYIDGNEFGKKQKASKTPREQTDFDQLTRLWRDNLLKQILLEIQNQPDWNTAVKVKGQEVNQIRLETLLWGGDEIIWVVPAWQGWWIVKRFYELANELKFKSKPLYHGAAIVFCKHNAPIYRIDNLARSLADGFAKQDRFKQNNMIAYQVLESFDHAGSDLYAERESLIDGLSTDISHLLIKAENMAEIETCIMQLKQYKFPKRKIYQIVQSYRNNNKNMAEKFYQKLIGDNRSDGVISKEQTVFKIQLDNLEKIFNGKSFWIHLMELWDYIGSDNMQPGQASRLNNG